MKGRISSKYAARERGLRATLHQSLRLQRAAAYPLRLRLRFRQLDLELGHGVTQLYHAGSAVSNQNSTAQNTRPGRS